MHELGTSESIGQTTPLHAVTPTDVLLARPYGEAAGTGIPLMSAELCISGVWRTQQYRIAARLANASLEALTARAPSAKTAYGEAWAQDVVADMSACSASLREAILRAEGHLNALRARQGLGPYKHTPLERVIAEHEEARDSEGLKGFRDMLIGLGARENAQGSAEEAQAGPAAQPVSFSLSATSEDVQAVATAPPEAVKPTAAMSTDPATIAQTSHEAASSSAKEAQQEAALAPYEQPMTLDVLAALRGEDRDDDVLVGLQSRTLGGAREDGQSPAADNQAGEDTRGGQTYGAFIQERREALERGVDLPDEWSALLEERTYKRIEQLYREARQSPENRNDETLIDGFSGALAATAAARNAAMAQLVNRDPTIIHKNVTFAYLNGHGPLVRGGPRDEKLIYVPGWSNPITVTARRDGAGEHLVLTQSEMINGKEYTGGLYPSQIAYIMHQIEETAYDRLLGPETLDLIGEAAELRAQDILAAQLYAAAEKAQQKKTREPALQAVQAHQPAPETAPTPAGLFNLTDLVDPDISVNLLGTLPTGNPKPETAPEPAANKAETISDHTTAEQSPAENVKPQPEPILSGARWLRTIVGQRRYASKEVPEPGLSEVRRILRRSAVGASASERLTNRLYDTTVSAPLAVLSAAEHGMRRRPSDPAQPFVKVEVQQQRAPRQSSPLAAGLRGALRGAAAALPFFVAK